MPSRFAGLARQTQIHGKFSARLAGIPASRYRDLRSSGWPGCHVIAKLIFVAFNRSAEILENRASSANRASPAHVIGPLVKPCNKNEALGMESGTISNQSITAMSQLLLILSLDYAD